VALRVDDVDLVRDRALVERFQEGDPAAFETLYRRYFARLARFCQKRVGDPHEAEEIAQEAFTRALRALPTFEGERRFYPWMTVIAGRLCVDAHRRRGRSEPSSQIDLGVIEGGQEKIVDAVDVQILATALGRLAPRHREVLDLREQQGWSYQQISDHYGVTLGTVEALLFRARKALKREFMAVVGDEPGGGAWAALPLVGGALGKVASWKARASAWASGLVPAVSGPALAAAVAVTAMTGAAVGGVVLHGSSGGGAPSAVVRLNGTPTSAVQTSLPELLSAVPAPTSLVDEPHRAATATATAPTTPTASPTAGAAVAGAVESVDTYDYEDGRPVAERDPVLLEPVSGEFTSLNPQNTSQDVVDSTINYLTQLGEKP
jgi:RNA polymerase sigma-70 factor (ECF subfamily)